jgi:hypothetical protein
VGVEPVSSYLVDYHPDQIVLRGGLATLEDFLEMTGVVVFIYALLAYQATLDKGTPGESRGRKATGPRLLKRRAPTAPGPLPAPGRPQPRGWSRPR